LEHALLFSNKVVLAATLLNLTLLRLSLVTVLAFRMASFHLWAIAVERQRIHLLVREGRSGISSPRNTHTHIYI
jgi:hypothetical protein